DRAGASGIPRRAARGRAQHRQGGRSDAARHARLVRLRARRGRHLLHRDAGAQVPQGRADREGGRREPDRPAGRVSVQVRHRRGNRCLGGPPAVRGAGAGRRPPVHARGTRAGVRRGGVCAPVGRVRAVYDPAGPLAVLRLRRRGGV
ncbi:MAG: FIG00825123: hypothetical protein, partial [uncultured Rubrobacteraceae bacterium]